jgi:tRNA(Ile)-lysidine synthase
VSVVEQVRELLRAGGLLAPGSRVVAMLSGGRDSVCLLDVVVALCGAENVRALHVNYGLRPESDADEDHCRALCAQVGVGVEVRRARREPGGGGNVHAWARDTRYAAAGELADRMDVSIPAGHDLAARHDASIAAGREPGGRHDASIAAVREPGGREPAGRHSALIAAGHTATDQVETILYRLAASPGRRALLGMPARDGRLVRPLLGVTREQTAAYCTELGLTWREDSSNDSPEYARARVRHGLLPALDAVHPAARANLLRTAELLREETELLDALVDAELNGASCIAIERLGELAPALARLVLIRLAEDATGTYVPQAGERVGEILALARRGGGAELHVGGLASAVIAGGELRMERIEPRPQRDARRTDPPARDDARRIEPPAQHDARRTDPPAGPDPH